MELEQLRQLVAFAEYGTLSKAAEALHLSQPSLSRTMQALEEELQGKLFVRQKNRIVLNETGWIAVEQARKVLSAAEELAERVRLAERSRQSISLGACAPVPIQDLRPLRCSASLIGRSISACWCLRGTLWQCCRLFMRATWPTRTFFSILRSAFGRRFAGKSCPRRISFS